MKTTRVTCRNACSRAFLVRLNIPIRGACLKIHWLGWWKRLFTFDGEDYFLTCENNYGYHSEGRISKIMVMVNNDCKDQAGQ